MRQLGLTTLALSLVFAISGNETPQSLHIERPALSRANVVELDVEEITVGGEASSGVRLCQEKSLSLLDGAGKPRAPKSRQLVSKKRKVSSSMISINERRA